jgi:sugar lactone lactonase YvrE
LIFLLIGKVVTAQSQSGGNSIVLPSEVLLTGLKQARAIDATDFGTLYITESGLHRFLVSDTTGVRIDSVGNLGAGSYQFNQPSDIDATNGLRIYVADYGNGRVQIYDRRHQYLSSIITSRSSDTGPYRPMFLSSNSIQELFIFDENSRQILKYNRRGELETRFGLDNNGFEQPPRDLQSSDQWLWVLQSNGKRLYRFNTAGSLINFLQLNQEAHALTMVGPYLWILFPDRLEIRTARGRIQQSYSISLPNRPQNLTIVDDQVFVLTDQKVFKFRIPK